MEYFLVDEGNSKPFKRNKKSKKVFAKETAENIIFIRITH